MQIATLLMIGHALLSTNFNTLSGGSRISRWEGGADPRCRHFTVKTCAKMKELDPVGGAPAAPPRSANDPSDSLAELV